MKVLNKLTIKNMLKNKTKTTTMIIAISLSCTLFFIVGFLVSTFYNERLKSTINYEGTYHIAVNKFEYKSINHVLNSNDLLQANIYSEIDTTNVSGNIVTILKLTQDTFSRVKLKEGFLPQNNNEIIIRNNELEQLNFKINDNIILNINDEEKTYIITGTYEKEPGFLGNHHSSNVFYTNDIFNDNDIVNASLTYRNINKNITKEGDKLSANLTFLTDQEGKRIGGINYNYNLLSLYNISTDFNSSIILAMILFISIIILTVVSFICFFVIYNSFEISLNERKNMIGVLSSIGSTPKQIISSVFFESIIVLLISIIFGLIISYFFSLGLISFLNYRLTSLIENPIEISFNYTYMGLSLVFIILTVFLATLSMSIKAKSISPIELIRNKETIINKKMKTNKLFLKTFGIEGEYARKNMKRNKKKYQVTTVSIVISIVLFVTFASFISYINKYINDIDPFNSTTIKVTLNKDSPIKEEVRNIKYVDVVTETFIKFFSVSGLEEYYSEDYKYYIKKEQRIDSNMNLMLPALIIKDEDYQNILKLHKIKYNDIVISDSYREHSNYTNKEVTRKTFNTNNIEELNFCNDKKVYEFVEEELLTNNVKGDCNLTINNISVIPNIFRDDYYSHTTLLIMSETKYNELVNYVYRFEVIGDNDQNNKELYDNFNDSSQRTLNIISKKYEKFDIEINKIFEKNNIVIENNEEYFYENYLLGFSDFMNNLNTIKIAIYIVITYIGMVGLLSIYNTINSSLELRKREFATLKSVGLSRKGFNKIAVYESIIISLKSVIYSLPFIYLILNLFSKIMNFEALITGENDSIFKFVNPPYYLIMISFLVVSILVYIINRNANKKITTKDIILIIK